MAKEPAPQSSWLSPSDSPLRPPPQHREGGWGLRPAGRKGNLWQDRCLQMAEFRRQSAGTLSPLDALWLRCQAASPPGQQVDLLEADQPNTPFLAWSPRLARWEPGASLQRLLTGIFPLPEVGFCAFGRGRAEEAALRTPGEPKASIPPFDLSNEAFVLMFSRLPLPPLRESGRSEAAGLGWARDGAAGVARPALRHSQSQGMGVGGAAARQPQGRSLAQLCSKRAGRGFGPISYSLRSLPNRGQR